VVEINSRGGNSADTQELLHTEAAESFAGPLAVASDVALLLEREYAVESQIVGPAGNPNGENAAFTSAVQ
jgi:hypothetical protein